MEKNKKQIDESDLDSRVADFKKQYDLLVKKYEVTFGSAAQLSQDGRIQAVLGIYSTREMPATEKPKKNSIVE
jgi:hypothetical protein